MFKQTLLVSIAFLGLCRAVWAAEELPSLQPLQRTVDLDVGESADITLSNGAAVRVKLLDLKETRDPVCFAVRRADVVVEIDGRRAELVSANYNLPKTVGAVQIDCPITKGNNENGEPSFWGLDKDARLRLWPAGSPLVTPGTFIYPVKQKWFATDTQMANEPVFVDGGDQAGKRKIYYHSGLDIGGSEGLVEVVAATDGLVVSVGETVLEGHEQDTPVAPRYDVVYLLDARGWYYRYSHLKEIDKNLAPGRVLKMGDRIGLLGKEGGSGGWSHLHFEIKSRQPSGKWGTEEGYAFLWEAYLRERRPKLIAVARPHQLIFAGDRVALDGGKSWSASGKIAAYQWQFSDGSKAEGPRVERSYPAPGRYAEILKIADEAGNVAYDFAVVQVVDREHPERHVPSIHANYSPTFDIRPGDAVTFKVRTFNTTAGRETWDFGDGSPPVTVHSDGNAVKLAPDGYAQTTHRYAKPGDYLASVERTNEFGVKAVGRLHVRVEAAVEGKQAAAKNSNADAAWGLIAPYFSPPAEWKDKLGDYRSPLVRQDGTLVRTAGEWQTRRKEILAEWHKLMGPWPALISNPEVEVLETTRRENFQQLRIRFRWTPDEFTTGYLLIPDGDGPRPAVLTVYYEPETAIGLGQPQRDFALQLARRGFVALSIGTTEATAAKTYALYYPDVDHAQVQPLSMLAYAAANAWHVLAARPEVDSKRIGVVGHSFGGKWAMFASCLFDKFACAAWSDPGIVFDDTRGSVNYWEPWYLGYHPRPWRERGLITAENPARGLYPQLRAAGRDLHELHALMAPRPFLVSGGSEDSPARWAPLNQTIAVNRLLGYSNRVAMTNRPEHAPDEASNAVLYAFFEHFLQPRP